MGMNNKSEANRSLVLSCIERLADHESGPWVLRRHVAIELSHKMSKTAAYGWIGDLISHGVLAISKRGVAVIKRPSEWRTQTT